MEYTYLNNTRAILITEMEKKDHQDFLDLFVEERIEVESWKKSLVVFDKGKYKWKKKGKHLYRSDRTS